MTEELMNIIALCTDLSGDKTPPEWVELLLAGPEIEGRDGRSWTLKDPQSIKQAFSCRGMSLVVDYEHSTKVIAPKGGEAPAAGWINDVAVRNDGSVWGRVEWTPRAMNSITSREYRYLSPAFRHSQDGERLELVSVALTNKPNLKLTALNTQQTLSKIALALNMEEVNSLEEVLTALNKRQAEQHSQIVNEYIEKAVFCLAQRNILLSMCSSVGENAFRKFADMQEKSTSNFLHFARPVSVKGKDPPRTLTESQLAVCRITGVSEEDYLIALKILIV